MTHEERYSKAREFLIRIERLLKHMKETGTLTPEMMELEGDFETFWREEK